MNLWYFLNPWKIKRLPLPYSSHGTDLVFLLTPGQLSTLSATARARVELSMLAFGKNISGSDNGQTEIVKQCVAHWECFVKCIFYSWHRVNVNKIRLKPIINITWILKSKQRLLFCFIEWTANDLFSKWVLIQMLYHKIWM